MSNTIQTPEQKQLSTLIKTPTGNHVQKFLFVDADGNVIPFGGGGIGSVTSIAAGTGLTGSPASPITTSGTLVVDTTVIATRTYVNTGDAATLASAEAYTDAKVTGLLDLRGAYDASSNLFPTTGGSGAAGAILKGDFYIVSVGGNLGGTDVVPYQGFFSLIDSPGQTAANWEILPVTMAFSLPITAPISTVVLQNTIYGGTYGILGNDAQSNLYIGSFDITGLPAQGLNFNSDGNQVVLATNPTATWLEYSKATTVRYSTDGSGFSDTSFTNNNGGTAVLLASHANQKFGAIYLTLTGDLSLWQNTTSIVGDQTTTNATVSDIAIQAGILPVGQQILISNPANAEALIVLCPTTNTFASSGLGKFLNNDWANSGAVDISSNPNYSDIEGQTGVAPVKNKGQWQTSEPTYNTGDIVFFNGLNFQVISAGDLNGTDPTVNTTAYTLLDKSIANVGYVEVWDAVIYDLVNSYLCLREDENGNRVEDSFNEGTGAIQVFQWGNPNCQGNAVKCGSYWDCQNNAGTILNNVLENFATVTTGSTNAGAIIGNQILAGQITLNKQSSFNFRNNVFRGKGGTNYIINNAQSDDLKRFESGFSNFECTVDITGLTTLDITTLNNYCGIINLTGGATEGINLITNRPIIPFTLLFLLITAFTVTGTSATIAGTDQIVLPTASYVGNGANGDFIKLQNDTINSSAVSKQIDAINNI